MDVKNRQQAISKILMKAWRERWTEYEFGCQIKVAFGSGPRLPIDSYNLTDAILEQTLIGAGVNKLLLSYLKHSLFSQLISYPAVIKRTTQYVHFEKYYCIKALLDFLISIIEGVTCRSKAEENALMESLLSLVCWLIGMTEKLLSKLVESNNTPTKEQEQCMEKVTKFTRIIVQNQFLMGVLYLARLEDRETYEKCVMGYKKIHSWNKHDAVKDLYQMVFVKFDHMDMKELEPKTVESISYCLQPFMSIEVLVHSTVDTSAHVSKFLMIQKLKKYSMSRLYFEIVRSCFMTMCHVKEFIYEYRLWGAFLLFKVPQILKQLHLQSKKADDKLEYSEDIVKAFEMLLESSPILDLLDTTFQCNSVTSILVELTKVNLINGEQCKKIIESRQLAIEKLEKFSIASTPPPIHEFVQQIDLPFTGICAALREPVKPEQLALMRSLLVDNLLFLLYQVAGVKGNHVAMINGIMKWNDSCKDAEVVKSKLTVNVCSNMFDISFILLYSVMQRNGYENFPEMNGDFFFEKWVREGMAESAKTKSPMSIVKQCDQSKVETLIGYFRDSSNQQQPPISLKYNEICMNLPALLYNVLIAWENETIGAAEVKSILDNMRSKMCCFAVISASWLCAYMKVLNEEEQMKPKVMVQILMQPLQEGTMKPEEKIQEKFSLTHEIIAKLLTTTTSTESSLVKHTQQKSLDDVFNEQWKEISEKKYLPFDVAKNLEQLFKSCGPFWLMKSLVDQIFKCKFIKEMETTTDIVFAIMHLNIEACTEALLREILPILLFNKNQCSTMKESQSRMLAKLCVYSVLSTMETAETNRKRPREDDEDMNPMTKMRKTGADQATEGTAGDKDSSSQLRESLRNSLQDLFKIFHQQVLTDEISPKVNFIFQFLSLLVQLEKSVKLKSILKLIPNGLIMNLLKIIPDEDLTYGFVLRLHDLSVSSGRATAISDLCLLRNIFVRKNSIKL